MGCLSFSVELWYMIVDYRTEIRSKAFKFFFVENRLGAGYGEFGVIIEAIGYVVIVIPFISHAEKFVR